MTASHPIWRQTWVAFLVLGAVTAFTRLHIALSSADTLDADESLVLLMARRIAEGRDLPLLHYGNAYLGSLDAYLAAALMRLGGSTAIAGRIVPVLLSIVFAWLCFVVARRAAGDAAGWWAGMFVATPPLLLSIWGAKFHLGYLDILILGTVLYLLILEHAMEQRRMRALGIGLASGLGLWCHLLFLPYLLTAGLYLLHRHRGEPTAIWTERREAMLAGIGFAVGILPLAAHNVAHPGTTVGMITAGSTADLGFLTMWASGFYNLAVAMIPVVLGAVPPWMPHRVEFTVVASEPLAGWVMTILLAAICALLVSSLSGLFLTKGTVLATRPMRKPAAMAAGVAITTLVIGLRTSVGEVPQPSLQSVQPHQAWNELSQAWLLVVLFYLPIALLARGAAGPRESALKRILGIHLLVSCMFYAMTSYGLHRSPRFLFPLYSALPILGGLAVARMNRRWTGSGITWSSGVCLVNLALLFLLNPIQALQPVPYVGSKHVQVSYDPLIQELSAIGCRSVYAPYWTAFPLVFESGETIAVANGMPGRVPDLDARVAADPNAAVVFFAGRLDDVLFQRLLHEYRVAHQVRDVPPFRIYHGLDLAMLREGPAHASFVRSMNLPVRGERATPE